MVSLTQDSPIFLLAGYTAVGKTELSLQWAEQNDAEIVSCDALLFYRGMDIGTAKPDVTEREQVQHHLIDICDVDEPMDIRSYLRKAEEAVRDIQARGKKVLITGGSGFYLKAFFAPVVDDLPVDESLRKKLESRLSQDGLADLVSELIELNPVGLEDLLDINNPRRVVRALERCLISGKSIVQLREDFLKGSNWLMERERKIVLLERPVDELKERIETRVQKMINQGLIQEVESLLLQGIKKNHSASSAIGYRETISWLEESRKDVEGLMKEIAMNTRRLVKKQRTWFRHQLPEHNIVHVSDADEGTNAFSRLFN
ncbi:MAG: tRNA (adenosine(37)-N6)-dimethylallyltransferase MiaA [Opitutaceae bacterium]|nr:tRNA (adenosine(37)-N6)-dimethylallyltransferase MiaA [Opitutaceae bacterium]